MSLELLAIDLGKQSFHLHGVDAYGAIVSRKVSRAKLAEVVEALAPVTIAMEACASAHHWGRLFSAAGHQVRLINPRFVNPFVKGSKNDAADAEAIFEAATRPTMRLVPVKSTGQQDLQSLHRDARATDRPSYCANQPHTQSPRRVRDYSAPGPVAVCGPSAGFALANSCAGQDSFHRPHASSCTIFRLHEGYRPQCAGGTNSQFGRPWNG
jgi:Transposase